MTLLPNASRSASNMRFTDSPLRLDQRGWLVQAEGPEDAIVKLLNVMVATPARGWLGSDSFGLREALAAMQAKEGARLMVIQQVNQTLHDLGIDWVKVTMIEPEKENEFGSQSYQFTLAYEGKGTVTHRVVMK